MTYLDKTHHDEWALYMSDQQLARLTSLLMADNSNEAKQMLIAIDAEIKAQGKRRMLVSRNIDFCEDCGGAGKMRMHITGTYEHDIETCHKCEGKRGELVTTIVYREPLTDDMENEMAPYPGQARVKG